MVEHDHVLASRWKRFAGALLDLLSVLVVMVLAILNVGMDRFHSVAEINPAEYPDYFAEQFGEYILSITYSPVLIVGFLVLLNVNLYFLIKNGQTIGKKMVGSRMVSAATGNKVSFLRIIFLRYAPFGLAFIPNLGKLLNLLDCLFVFREDRRCIHDLIAGTVVVDAARSSDSTADSSHDSDIYDQVAEEIESDNLISGVWTRAFAEADGDENRAKAIYIKLRFEALSSKKKERVSEGSRVKKERRRAEKKKKPRLAIKRFVFQILTMTLSLLAGFFSLGAIGCFISGGCCEWGMPRLMSIIAHYVTSCSIARESAYFTGSVVGVIAFLLGMVAWNLNKRIPNVPKKQKNPFSRN